MQSVPLVAIAVINLTEFKGRGHRVILEPGRILISRIRIRDRV